MTASMLGMERDEVEDEEDVKDVIGELCNIIGGNLKSKLCDAGMFCTLSTPSYTSGSDFVVERQDMTSYERIKFAYQDEEFYIEAGIKLSESADISHVQKTEEESVNGIESVISQDDIDALLKSGVSESETDQDKVPSAEEIQEEIDNIIKSESPTVKEKVEDSVKQESDGISALEENNLDLVLDIPLEIKVEFGKTGKTIDEVLKIDNGSVIEFPNMEGEPVNLVVNNTLIARGEVVVEKEGYGIRITETVSRIKRIQSIM
jgi:flagellar motor switch protein FliN